MSKLPIKSVTTELKLNLYFFPYFLLACQALLLLTSSFTTQLTTHHILHDVVCGSPIGKVLNTRELTSFMDQTAITSSYTTLNIRNVTNLTIKTSLAPRLFPFFLKGLKGSPMHPVRHHFCSRAQRVLPCTRSVIIFCSKGAYLLFTQKHIIYF